MSDILIDLGPSWNHIIPLSTLMHISHIEINHDKSMSIECSIDRGDTVRVMKYTSFKRFTDSELISEKIRLLGLSNGIISKDDMMKIIKTMEAQTGKKLSITLDQPIYDIHYIRRIWASVHSEPFFRFILQYDPKEQEVKAIEEHNDEFVNILGGWLDDHSMQVVTETDDRILLFAYNAMERMAEPIIPLTDAHEFMDPNANIPVMGDATQGLATQRVDLSKISGGNTMMKT